MHSVQSILYPSLNSNLDGISADIFLRGCKGPHCKGCHNLELQQFSEPNKTTEDIIESIRPHENNLYVITIMGGEPLDRDRTELLGLIIQLKSTFINVKLSMYTGYTFEDVKSFTPEFLEQLDYIKCGRYQEDNRTPFGSFLASKNQIMYHKTKETWNIQWQYTD